MAKVGSAEMDLSQLESVCPRCSGEWGEAKVWKCGHSVCHDCNAAFAALDTPTVECFVCKAPSNRALLSRSPDNHALAKALVTIRALQTALVLSRLDHSNSLTQLASHSDTTTQIIATPSLSQAPFLRIPRLSLSDTATQIIAVPSHSNSATQAIDSETDLDELDDQRTSDFTLSLTDITP